MTPYPEHADKRLRQGFTMIEVIVASGIIGALFLVTIPLLSQIRMVRQQARQRMIAGEETANVMEAVTALAQRGELTDQSLAGLGLSPAAARLPEALLELQRTAAEAPFSGQRVTVTVSWAGDTGAPEGPVVLTAWFPAKEEQ